MLERQDRSASLKPSGRDKIWKLDMFRSHCPSAIRIDIVFSFVKKLAQSVVKAWKLRL